jgi:T4-like virus Myoviridae tail sheath stabiliser
MLHFYDAQIRRYITQTVRIFSNFVVKYGDGTLHRIPVMYGDADRQVASIIRNNSENKVNSVPKIAVYVSALSLDRSRTSDASFVGKVHVRERDTQTDPTTGHTTYNQANGRNYTVERLMPTPFKLTMKVDIWSANTEQKLQIMEQILVLFNPSLELQTTDNYIDWTSLSVLDLTNINWSSRTVPAGVDSAIEIATLTVETPIWISPPVKVKHLGVITKIVTSLWGSTDTSPTGYIEGLGEDLAGSSGTPSYSDLLAREIVTITDYTLQVYNNTSGVGQAILLTPNEGYIPREPTLEIPVRQGVPINWQEVLNRYPGKFTAGSSRIYLTQSNGTEVSGSVALPVDATGSVTDSVVMLVNWDRDTLVTNTGIDSTGKLDFEAGYNAAGSYRSNSTGTFDAIINPLTFNPGTATAGRRYLIIEDIGAVSNTNYSAAWGNVVAKANDIIEYTGTSWKLIFSHTQHSSTMVWQTNIYTGVQYLWNGVSWVKSFEGEYQPGSWRLEL